MNRLSPLTLPRFDVKALARTARTHEAQTDAPDPQSDFAPEAAPEVESQLPDESAAELLQTPTVPELPSVDTGTLLASLEQSLAEIERTALATCHQALSEFFAAAFPRLTEAFLSEEIKLAVSTIAPPKIERLNIHVPAALEASFSQSLKASERLSDICELHTRPAADELIVDVDWGEGGLQFDMDQFLNSSQGRLAGLQHT